ncbi:Alternative cytochrome c oxidase subunit 1 [bacterium HR15]|nr:Alternative cytochrome c oxidase subunit 1 [bacterium HR15]
MAVHAEHLAHAHSESWIRKYVFSTDHKVIATQYIFTAYFMALLGGLLAALIRYQLGWGDQASPLLERLFPFGAQGGVIKPEFYLAIITIHGTILVFHFQTMMLTGGFGNYLIPLQIGARDMAFPVLNMLSYWVFLASCVVMLLSFLVEGGAAAAGWTVYPPLSVHAAAVAGSGLGQTIWLLSMALLIVATLMGGLNYIVTTLNLRTKGMSLMRLPLSTWGVFFASVIGLVTFPVLLAGAILLLLDRHLGTSFYMPTVYIGGQLVETRGGNPLLWQHLFWYLGHPEVYILAIPALGFIGDIIATFSRKPIFGYRLIIISFVVMTILSCIVWGHHMFTSGLNPYIAMVFSLLTILISVPFGTIILCYAATLWKGKIQFTTPMLFAIGFLSLVVTGGLGGLFLGTASTDLYLHDTAFVVGHFHVIMASSVLFAIFAATYYWFPKIFGRFMSESLGKWHFWLTFIGVYATFVPMHVMGLGGMMRRIYSPHAYQYLQQWVPWERVISIFGLILIGAQLLFVVNFFWSLFKGRRATDPNPWRANTLEWQTSSPPPHLNWGEEQPVVYRGPYEFSRPDTAEDYLPQNTPPVGVEVSGNGVR